MKTFLFLLFIAAIGGGGYYYYKTQQANDVIEYQTVKVTRGELTQAVTATGILNAVVNVQVGSQISGNIKELMADYNSDVKAGQVVAQLNPAIYRAIVNQVKGDLASAKASLELARITAKRKGDLVKLNAAPQAELDSAQAALLQAEALVQIKEANLEKAKVDLDNCTIYSPIDGTVISRSVDVGQTVAASMSAPVLFTIANDLKQMQINAAVAEADIGMVADGQEVNFTVDAFPTTTFKGKVSQVRNAATTVQNVVTYDVVISVKNEELKLKPGMTANVSIVVAHRGDSLKVPNAALRYRPPEPLEEAPKTASASPPSGGGPRGDRPPGGGGDRQRGSGGPRGDRSGGGRRSDNSGHSTRTLYVLKDGKPAPVEVKMGITDGVATEVLEGIEDNTDVVTGQIGGLSKSSSTPAANPFGGGGPRFR